MTPTETAQLRARIKNTSKASKRGCWLWTGAKSGRYGMMHYRGVLTTAHRYAYMAFVGPIPKGLQIDHLCRVRRCVNPAHLEAVTQRENILRGNGVAAKAARKKKCKRGHLLAGDNLLSYGLARGERVCKTCEHARGKRRWQRTGA